MARARNIKPGFFLNEDLAELSFEYRLLFIGLWTIADKKGRLEDRPKRIKMAVFPADNVDITEGLALLNRYGFVKQYERNGVKYVQISNWEKHQSPHHTEKQSLIPEPLDNGVETVDSLNQDGGNPPDSLIHRFTDSLIPDSKAPFQDGVHNPPTECTRGNSPSEKIDADGVITDDPFPNVVRLAGGGAA